jgi:hypothetical protein
VRTVWGWGASTADTAEASNPEEPARVPTYPGELECASQRFSRINPTDSGRERTPRHAQSTQAKSGMHLPSGEHLEREKRGEDFLPVKLGVNGAEAEGDG